MTDAIQLLNQHFAVTYDGWIRIADALKEAFACLKDDAFLAERPATKFILTWMHKLGEFHTMFGKLFGRIKRPSKADEFTAAVAICLEQFLAARGYVGLVRSEETTHRAKGAKRPDVTVYSTSGKHSATIECKTDFGWKRKKWKDEIEARRKQLLTASPDSELYLCVLTRSNWDYSEFQRSENCGKRWFCLSTAPVGRIADPVTNSDILLPIEPMFLDIMEKIRFRLVEQLLQSPVDEQKKLRRLIEEKGSDVRELEA